MVLYGHIVCWLCEILKCGSHIYLVIYVKYVYNAPCCIVDGSNFINSIYICIHIPYVHVRYLVCIACMLSLIEIFVCEYIWQ